MKICLPSLIIREKQIKATVRITTIALHWYKRLTIGNTGCGVHGNSHNLYYLYNFSININLF